MSKQYMIEGCGQKKVMILKCCPNSHVCNNRFQVLLFIMYVVYDIFVTTYKDPSHCFVTSNCSE